MNTTEFGLRENNTGSVPRGIALMFRAMGTWLYGGDPLEPLSFEVPLINRAAVAHLLARGFHMQPFFAFMMSDGPVEQFENYVLFSPPFFV